MRGVTKITLSDHVTLITINSFNSSSVYLKLLKMVSDAGINVDMISQTPPLGGKLGFSFTRSDADLMQALTILGSFQMQDQGICCEISSGNSKLSFYGEEMRDCAGVASEVFLIFSETGVQAKLITTSTVDISVLIDRHSIADVLNKIREKTAIEVSFS